MAGNNKTVLVVDGWGRGAALIHKYSQSPQVGKLIAVPGNPLMQINSEIPVKIFPHLTTTSIKEIIEICKKEKVDLVDVAQDNAVEAGLADALEEAGTSAIGPSRLAGQIEWDKAWARNFMKKNKIPHPAYKVFTSKKNAKDYIKRAPNKKYFVKATGLVEGKGALPAENKEKALLAISEMSKFGKAGEKFVIEDWLEGEEFSTFAITDGMSFQIIGSAQDHKRLYDADQGPNTGGIGSSTPPLVVTKNIYKQEESIIRKTILGLAKEGRVYKGLLYLGAIVVNKKVYVVEFNARWGSPEAEVLVPGIKNDLFEISMSVVKERLHKSKILTDRKSRIAVTGSTRPGIETKERELFGLENALKIPGITIYGSRVFPKKGKFFVTAGRLFHLVAEGKNIIEVRKKAYQAMSMLFIEGNNLHYRTDIGWRDMERVYQ
ncbi:MAG: phosphoribosylamine--glycine ligase [Candidatus Levybacteria bacterium]|nr:phosphoribosylamine--glycine ligase [Candidatus Levybacteria bacterium]